MRDRASERRADRAERKADRAELKAAKKAGASKQGIAAGIVGGLGAVFAVAGLSDCN